MIRSVLFTLAALFAVSALAQAPAASCTMEASGSAVAQAEAACFPTLTDACTHSMEWTGKVRGAANADVNDAKAYGTKIMNFANSHVCEGKNNCGPYTLAFQSTATCAGKAVQDMPGGEYRGLTAQAVRKIQDFTNRTAEQVAERGKSRGQKGKGNGKDKLWGNE